MTESTPTRAERNNNPLNIRAISPHYWDGQVGIDDDGFATFESPDKGFRAVFINLYSYRTGKRLWTIRDIVSSWAPPGSNPTQGYIGFVSSWMERPPRQRLTWPYEYPALVCAMATFESGGFDFREVALFEGLTQALEHIEK